MKHLHIDDILHPHRLLVKILLIILFLMLALTLIGQRNYPPVEVGSFSAEFPGCAAFSQEKWYDCDINKQAEVSKPLLEKTQEFKAPASGYLYVVAETECHGYLCPVDRQVLDVQYLKPDGSWTGFSSGAWSLTANQNGNRTLGRPVENLDFMPHVEKGTPIRVIMYKSFGLPNSNFAWIPYDDTRHEGTVYLIPDKKVSSSEGDITQGISASQANIADVDVYEFPYLGSNLTNWGGWGSMELNSNINGMNNTRRRIYLQFDLNQFDLDPDDLPPVQLVLHKTAGGLNNVDIHAYRVTSSWEEGNGMYLSGEQAPPAEPGEITWVNQPGFDESTIWATARGMETEEPTSMSWEITELVRGWLANDFPNHGIVLIGESEGMHKYNYTFWTTEAEDETKRPKLVFESPTTKATYPLDQTTTISYGLIHYAGMSIVDKTKNTWHSPGKEYPNEWIIDLDNCIMEDSPTAQGEWDSDYPIKARDCVPGRSMTFDFTTRNGYQLTMALSFHENGERIEGTWSDNYNDEGRIVAVKKGYTMKVKDPN
jgi:hypothetical protein